MSLINRSTIIGLAGAGALAAAFATGVAKFEAPKTPFQCGQDAAVRENAIRDNARRNPNADVSYTNSDARLTACIASAQQSAVFVIAGLN